MEHKHKVFLLVALDALLYGDKFSKARADLTTQVGTFGMKHLEEARAAIEAEVKQRAP